MLQIAMISQIMAIWKQHVLKNTVSGIHHKSIVNMKKLVFSLIVLSLMIASCQPQAPKDISTNQSDNVKAVSTSFNASKESTGLSKYWYQGKAELNRYELQQNRYGDLHPGEAVVIFVTEDFLTDRQVKNDNYSNPNSTPILKMNMLRRFTTGLYDYSIMSSVFTPTKVEEWPQTLKVTTSSQDWCGHSFMQINYQPKEQAYQQTLRSYFESEGDRVDNIDYAILEDELMNRLRMDPNTLPTGTFQIIPSTTVLRLRHLPFAAVIGEGEIKDYEGADFDGDNLKVYIVQFPGMNRTLEIIYQNELPYIIEGWTDTYPSMFDRKARTTIAKRKETILSPYWQKNNPEDEALRDDLGLSTFGR
jgi:hypothetical protein